MQKEKNKEYSKQLIKKEYLSPEFLYLPISNNVKYYVDSKTKIYKETLLFSNSDHKFYSPISGKALGIKKIKNKDFLVLQNNFKEKYSTEKSCRKRISKLSKKEVLDILNNADCKYYSSNIKYFLNNFESIDSLVLNMVICEESERINSIIFNEYNNDLMEMFDSISQIFDIKKPILIISDTDDINIEYVTNLTGMYPNIRIVLTHDKYPYSHPLLITRKLSVENSLVLNPMDLYYLNNILKRDKKVLEKSIYIVGENLENSYLVNTKLNVLVKDILDFCKIKVKSDEVICKNSAIKGEIISLDDFLDTDVDSLIIVKKEISDQKECINCGLCNKFCPQKLNPQRYKLTEKPFPGKCIDCNMCSYVCPSKIGRKR